ncbi:DUF3616 domain-containing protein [Acaryochloris sp. IP29b_bin.137]|uniref:DUF3616 domain-containing protein n=1 Tax=Acaryochloris sp. IP29b_bin.137 TaxID=2969217 RepID=UPI00262134A3|nr:DUF3616 domain-containing protein [Acaryochloris sp. IP29b_bin.137]
MPKIQYQEQIKFEGSVHQEDDISAIVAFKDFLAIGSDESKDVVQLLRQEEKGYSVISNISLSTNDDSDEEIDIEGMAIDKESILYVIGSHSAKRKTIKTSKTYLVNRQRLATVVQETKKNTIFKLKLDSNTGQPLKRELNTQLKDVLEQNIVLSRFLNIPSKENGIDIEGLAVHDKQLYIGFRGPVLRGNYVPVMVAEFDDLLDYELRYVQLAGNGIRDITRVKAGFLLIAGPVGDAPGPYQLYLWNGKDTIPGEDRPTTSDYCQLIGEIPRPEKYPEAKAEGVTVLEDNGTKMTAIIIYDGAPQGEPTLFKIEL